MTTINQKSIGIDQNWLDQNRNDKANNSSFDRLSDLAGKSSGAYRGVKLIQYSAKVANIIGQDIGLGNSPKLSSLSSNMGIGGSALGLIRIPYATSEAVKSLSALKEDNGISFSRKAAKAVRETMDAAAAYGYGAYFVFRNSTALTAAQVVDLASDSADFQISASNFGHASKLEAVATNENVKKALNHAKKYYFLCTVKAVIGIASAILGFVALALGSPLLPALAWAILSLLGTVIAIRRDTYKDSGEFKIPDFDRDVKLVTI